MQTCVDVVLLKSSVNWFIHVEHFLWSLIKNVNLLFVSVLNNEVYGKPKGAGDVRLVSMSVFTELYSCILMWLFQNNDMDIVYT